MADSYFMQAFVYLAAAVIAVPITKRLGLGSALGYLLAWYSPCRQRPLFFRHWTKKAG